MGSRASTINSSGPGLWDPRVSAGRNVVLGLFLPSTSSDQTYPIQGLIGLFLFGIMFLEHGRKFEPEKRRVLAVLTPKEQCIFQVLGSFAVVSIAAFVGLIWIFCSSASRGTGIEILFMVLYLLYCWLYYSLNQSQ